MTGWPSNVYVCICDVEFWVYIAEYGVVGLNNSFEVDIDEEVIRVNVLFDETFDFQKGWKKVPFILSMVRRMVATVSVFQITRDISAWTGRALFPLAPESKHVWARVRNPILNKQFCSCSTVRRHKVSSCTRDDAD